MNNKIKKDLFNQILARFIEIGQKPLANSLMSHQLIKESINHFENGAYFIEGSKLTDIKLYRIGKKSKRFVFNLVASYRIPLNIKKNEQKYLNIKRARDIYSIRVVNQQTIEISKTYYLTEQASYKSYDGGGVVWEENEWNFKKELFLPIVNDNYSKILKEVKLLEKIKENDDFSTWVKRKTCTKIQFLSYIKIINEMDDEQKILLIIDRPEVSQFIDKKPQQKKISEFSAMFRPHYYMRMKQKFPEHDLLMVKNDGNALEFVKEQSEEICLEAVKQNGSALMFVKKQTEQICLEAVKQKGWALKYVEKQTPKICMVALNQDPDSCRHVRIVPNPDFETTLSNLKKKQLILEII